MGIAGLVGAGRSDIAASLFGAAAGNSGQDLRAGPRGHDQDASRCDPTEIGLVPEDRKRQGLVQSESGRHNMSLRLSIGCRRLACIRPRNASLFASDYFHLLRVRTPAWIRQSAGCRAAISRRSCWREWLAARAKVLILDEPTRGVDVGAKAEIHALIGELAARDGDAGDLERASRVAESIDRILVLRAGRLVGEVPGQTATQDGLLRLMAGLH